MAKDRSGRKQPLSGQAAPGSVDPFAASERYQETLKRICRVEVVMDREIILGTGILVAPDVVLTCYHVLKPIIQGEVPAGAVTFRFEYRMQSERPVAAMGVEYRLRKEDWIIDFAADSSADCPPYTGQPSPDELDYALVRVADRLGNPPQRGSNPLPAIAIPFYAKSPLFILHHPEGDTLKRSDGQFLELNGNATRLKHNIQTAEGSSGAPCFDEQNNLAAIHQRADEDGSAIPAYAITHRLKRLGKFRQLVQTLPPSTSANSIDRIIRGLQTPQQVRNLRELIS